LQANTMSNMVKKGRYFMKKISGSKNFCKQ
jgi:hypothetical protein